MERFSLHDSLPAQGPSGQNAHVDESTPTPPPPPPPPAYQARPEPPPQLPAQMFTTAAQLLDLTDSEVLPYAPSYIHADVFMYA